MHRWNLTVLTLAALLFAAAAPCSAALITFSGLHNGINTANDPEDNNTPDPTPANYQPLLNAYPAPNSNVDGANIGVTITWANAHIAAQPFLGIFDHTAMVSSDNAEEEMYGNGANIDVRFDKSVSIPSLYFANYSSGSNFNITLSGFTNVGDVTPAVTVTRTYNQPTGFTWIQETGLGTTPIKQLVISGANYIQTDDYTVNLPVPEPSSLALCGLGATLLVAARRRRQSRPA